LRSFASLAQLVEQLIRNEQVVGSSPIGGSNDCGVRIFDCGFIVTNLIDKSEIINRGSSSVVEHQLPKLRVGGSRPLSRSN
jgi:hypothetical protein